MYGAVPIGTRNCSARRSGRCASVSYTHLYVKNLFDDNAQYNRFTQCAEAVCGGDVYSVSAPPRMFGIKFSQDF